MVLRKNTDEHNKQKGKSSKSLSIKVLEAWRSSNDFKAIHSRQASGSGESPVISNRVVISEIAGMLVK